MSDDVLSVGIFAKRCCNGSRFELVSTPFDFVDLNDRNFDSLPLTFVSRARRFKDLNMVLNTSI